MKALNLFLQVIDVFIDNFKGFRGLLTILNLYLNKHAPLFGLNSELFGLFQSILLLSANFNCSCDIENCVFPTLGGFFNELGDFFWLFGLDITVKQEGCVIFVIVCQRVEVGLVPLGAWRVNQLL